MDFPSTQIMGNDILSQPLNSSTSNHKVQIGVLEAGSRKYQIFNGLTKVGRNPTCQVCIPDGTVSKNHAEIEADGKTVFICDLNSSNKTRLNEYILRPERFYSVQDGASLKFGIIETRFFLVHPEDSSLLAPETPERQICARSQENYALVEASPGPTNDNARFRRPFPAKSPKQPSRNFQGISMENIQSLETQLGTGDSEDLQNMETQVLNVPETSEKQNTVPQVKHSASTAKVNIEDMETQKFDVNKAFKALDNNRNDQPNIEDLETQFNATELDIQNAEAQISHLKPEEKTKSVSSKRLSEHQRHIEEIKTQIFGVDEPKSVISDDEDIHDLPTQTNFHYSESLKLHKESEKNGRSVTDSPDLLANTHVIIAESDEETDEEGLFKDIEVKINEKLVESKSFEGRSGEINSNSVCDSNRNDKVEKNAGLVDNDTHSSQSDDKVQLSKTRGDKAKFRRNAIVSDSDSDGEENCCKPLRDNRENSRRAEYEKSPKAQEADGKSHFHVANRKNDPLEEPNEKEGSETDFEDKNPDKDDSGGFKNAISSKQSASNACYAHSEETRHIKVLQDSKQRGVKSSKNRRTNLRSSNHSDLPPEVINILNKSKHSEDNDSGSDDPYSAPTQRISLPHTSKELKRPEKSPKNSSAPKNDSDGIINSDEDTNSTQIINFEKLRNDKNEDTNGMELTQVIKKSGFKHTILDDMGDDLDATQKIDIADEVNRIPEKTTENLVDDLAPTQVIDILQTNDEPRTVNKFVKRTRTVSEDDIAPTQLIIPLAVKKKQAVSSDQTVSQKSSKNHMNKSKKQESLSSINISQASPKRTLRSSNKTIGLSSDEEISLGEAVACRNSSENHEKIEKIVAKPIKAQNSNEMTSSTPLRTSPEKRRRFNLSLRSRKEKVETKNSAFEETDQSSSEKSVETSLNDSIDRHLGSMFSEENQNSNDKIDINGSPLMTQQVLEVLQPTQQQPEKLVENRKSSKASRNLKRNMKQSEELPEDSQDVYFSALKAKKRRKTVLKCSQDMSDEELAAKPSTSGFCKGKAVARTEKAIAPVSPRKSTRLSHQNQPKKSSDDVENCEEFPKMEIWETNSCPGSPASSINSSSVPKKTGKSPEKGKDAKLRKIADSDDEDLDFERVSAMADTYLAAKPGTSPGRPKKSNQISSDVSIKAAAASHEKHLIRNKENYKGRNPKEANIKKSSESLSKERPDKISQELKKTVETPTRRRRKKKEAETSVTVISDDVSIPKLENNFEKTEERLRKRGRPRKIDEENSIVENKKRRIDDSSSEGQESQEVQRILASADAVSEKRNDRKSTATKKPVEKILEDSPSKTARYSRNKEGESIKHEVLLTKVDDEAQEISLSVAMLGGTIATDPLKATILVTDKIRRTLKFFVAVARSIPIVTIAWLEASKKVRRFVDPEKFLLQDPQTEKKFKFSLKKSLAKAGQQKMLEGCTVLITQNITGPTIPEIKTMIQVSGGKPLVRPPKKWPGRSIVVTCQKDLAAINKILAKSDVNVPVVNMEFLLSGILRQQVSYDEFRFNI